MIVANRTSTFRAERGLVCIDDMLLVVFEQCLEMR